MATTLKSITRNVGRSVQRIEDVRLTSGNGLYVDDYKDPNTLYCAILRSPYGHARILSIDTSKATAHPNDVAVITGTNLL